MTEPVAIHPLVSPWGRFGLYSFFIDAPEPAIVDTGIASSPAEGMVPALEALGRRIEDVRWILLTHGHIDHLGGAHALWELTGRRAKVVIHEADAPLLRSRRAHVDQYVDVRQQYLDNPERRRGADEGGEPRHLRRDGADHAGARAARRSPSAGTSPSRCTTSRATRPGPSPTSWTGSSRSSSATPCRSTERPTASPATRIRPPTARACSTCATTSARSTCTWATRTAARTACRTASSWTARQARNALQGSLDLEARIDDAARRYLRAGLQETDSPYSPVRPRGRGARLRRRPHARAVPVLHDAARLPPAVRPH